MEKTAQGDKSAAERQGMSNLLAEALKRRIDPNDLYNIVIRPAGGEGRVEIILPTGGVERNERAEEEWQNLLNQLKVDYKLEQKPQVPRGRVQELTDYVLLKKQEEVWEKMLYGTPQARKEHPGSPQAHPEPADSVRTARKVTVAPSTTSRRESLIRTTSRV